MIGSIACAPQASILASACCWRPPPRGWYLASGIPYPYRDLSGGRELFTLVVSVDVILGPLVTLIIFNRAKPRTELVRDLTVVALIQLAGLGYGLWSVYVARPVHLVFELDRFRAVHAVDVPEELLLRASGDYAALPVGRAYPARGASLREPARSRGGDPGRRTRPSHRGPPRVLAALRGGRSARSVGRASRQSTADPFPAKSSEIAAAIESTGLPEEQVAYLPLVARRSVWTVLLNARTGRIVGYLPLDSF